jgi:GTP-binding protein EngB required for normal cell division
MADRDSRANEVNMNLTDHTVATDVLHDYARLKLDLAAIVRTLLYSAEKSKDEISIQDCRRVLARLAEDRFNLAVVGQFSRGKSSLMNAILGIEKLPTGILPLTSVITTVAYGEKERVLLLREGWTMTQEIRLDQLPEYVTQDRNPGNEKKVLLAEVQLPHELLRLGVHFVDTPGVASSIVANTRTTRQFLPEADAAILVTSFESPMTEAEVAFLEEVRTHVHKVFIVVNKLDLVTEAEREPVLEAVRNTIRTVLPDSNTPVFAVSARRALAAKKSGSATELSSSGLPLLESALSDFLKTDKARESLLNTASRSMRIVERQQTSIHISQRARRPEEGAHLQARLAELTAKLVRDRDSHIEAMRDRLPEEFVDECSQIAPRWTAETEASVGARIQSWFGQNRVQVSGPPFETLVQTALQEQFSGWVSKHQKSINDKFQEITRRESTALEKLTTEITALPSAILEDASPFEISVPAAPLSLDLQAPAFRELRVATADFEPPWWYDVLPLRILMFLGERWKRRASELRASYEKAASRLLSLAMNDWIDAAGRDLSSQLERIAEHTHELLTQTSKLNEMADLDGVTKRLEQFMKSVLQMGNENPDTLSPMTLGQIDRNPDMVSLKPCKICLAVEKTLRDYMAHRQYELAVSESEQRNHALRSGFCPVHTWQYEAVASPQGICAAYSELLHLYAKRLRLLAENEPSLQEMESGVRSMLPTQASCPACQLVSSTEKAVAREIARGLRDDQSAGATVCAFHLRFVLTAGPDRNAARRLLLEEARAFQRLGENMQNHILKHEAVRHHLSTNAEQEAATAGLARLVGRRNTAAPWKIE